LEGTESIPGERPSQDDRYQEVADTYGPALDRLARAYEADPEARRDLLQDIHLQLWRSFALNLPRSLAPAAFLLVKGLLESDAGAIQEPR
jgi:DNA-directed RNA polymerase specialized sigma24 family protein